MSNGFPRTCTCVASTLPTITLSGNAPPADAFSPAAPTAIDRAFAVGAEMPEARVKALLEEVLTSPLVPKVAAHIEKSVGRKLEPTGQRMGGCKHGINSANTSILAQTNCARTLLYHHALDLRG